MQLVNDKDLAKRLGDNGFNNINNNLTLNMVGKRLMSVIRIHFSHLLLNS
jgi:hypothetical protein